jgi:hypothetical protein
VHLTVRLANTFHPSAVRPLDRISHIASGSPEGSTSCSNSSNLIVPRGSVGILKSRLALSIKLFFPACTIIFPGHCTVIFPPSIVIFAPCQAFLGQQALDEGQVGFAVLAAVAARRRRVHEGHDLLAPAPACGRSVVAEHGFDDVDHARVLPHAAVAHMRQAPDPVGDAYAVARQAAFAAQLGELADFAGEAGTRAVGQADLQAGRLAQQGWQLDEGAGGDGDHVARADSV